MSKAPVGSEIIPPSSPERPSGTAPLPPSVLGAALAYAARGWSVLPVMPGTKKPGTEKLGLLAWTAHQMRLASEARIRQWFGGGSRDGLALVMGPVSGGLTVRDFDKMDAYDAWASAFPELARTLPTVETARGRHVYFRSGVSGIVVQGDGELRGAGICLAPPTLHPGGVRYRWAVPLPPGELPFVDPFECGLAIRDRATERTEGAERTERAEEDRRVQKPGGGVASLAPSLAALVDAAILETLPQDAGQRNRAVFEFARALRGIPALADAAAVDLKPYVRRWHEKAKPVIVTQPFEETWFDFARGWDRVQFPKGSEPMAEMLHRARASPPPAVAETYEQPALRLLVALARELQRNAGGGPFFISCRTAGRLLGVDPATAARWLAGLELDGVLRVASRGSAKTQRATRFHYMGGRVGEDLAAPHQPKPPTSQPRERRVTK